MTIPEFVRKLDEYLGIVCQRDPVDGFHFPLRQPWCKLDRVACKNCSAECADSIISSEGLALFIDRKFYMQREKKKSDRH